MLPKDSPSDVPKRAPDEESAKGTTSKDDAGNLTTSDSNVDGASPSSEKAGEFFYSAQRSAVAQERQLVANQSGQNSPESPSLEQDSQSAAERLVRLTDAEHVPSVPCERNSMSISS